MCVYNIKYISIQNKDVIKIFWIKRRVKSKLKHPLGIIWTRDHFVYGRTNLNFYSCMLLESHMSKSLTIHYLLILIADNYDILRNPTSLHK